MQGSQQSLKRLRRPTWGAGWRAFQTANVEVGAWGVEETLGQDAGGVGRKRDAEVCYNASDAGASGPPRSASVVRRPTRAPPLMRCGTERMGGGSWGRGRMAIGKEAGKGEGMNERLEDENERGGEGAATHG
jgi:hypothetical protein